MARDKRVGSFLKVSCLHSLNLNFINVCIYPIRTLKACRDNNGSSHVSRSYALQEVLMTRQIEFSRETGKA